MIKTNILQYAQVYALKELNLTFYHIKYDEILIVDSLTKVVRLPPSITCIHICKGVEESRRKRAPLNW